MIKEINEGTEGPKEYPDAIVQLVQCFQRAATSEQKQARLITDDLLYMDYAEVMAKSIHIKDEDDDSGGDEEEGAAKEVLRYIMTSCPCYVSLMRISCP